MTRKSNSKMGLGGSLNTLADNETDIYAENAEIIIGKGTELGNSRVSKGRAKRKMISKRMSLVMIKISEQKKDITKIKSFCNTFHCQDKLVTYDGRFYGKYCKNRNCTLCCSIRKADIINRYLPVLKTWEDPHFVTLTVKACKLGKLKLMMKGFVQSV